MNFLFDYTFLRITWWILTGVLFWLFATFNGLDLGVATISATVFKKDIDRRILLNTVGPVWEGNQVWLILGAGILFAIWPLFYGVLFSALYLPMFAVLLSLILRPVGFKFRSKIPNPKWKRLWDMCIGIGGATPALGFGLLLGTMLSGIDFHFDENLRLHVTGNVSNLLKPMPLISALFWLLLCITHGALFLLCKTEGTLAKRIEKMLPQRLIASIVIFFLLFCIWQHTIPQHITTGPTDAASNPLLKDVLPRLPNETWIPQHTFMWFALSLFFGLTVIMGVVMLHKPGLAFICNAFRMATVIGAMGYGSFPFMIISQTNVSHSLTIWDASSSMHSLLIVLFCALFFLPIMFFSVRWVYWVLRGTITDKDVANNTHHWY